MPTNDILRTAKRIADALNCSERQAYYLCETGKIPSFQIGRIWHARRSTLDRFMAEREAESLERARAAGGSS